MDPLRSGPKTSRAPEPTVGAMEAAQTLAWPNPNVYAPTKPTAAKARRIPAAGVLLVLLDVSEMLNLGRCQQRCNSMVHATAWRDFSCSSLVTWPPGLSCDFSPNFTCVPPTGVCS